MKKTLTTIIITLSLITLFASCSNISSETAADTAEDEESSEITAAPTAEPSPTATPEPLTQDQIEALLEDTLGVSLSYIDEMADYNAYQFQCESGMYYIAEKETGKLLMYVDNTIDDTAIESTVSLEDALQMAYDTAYYYCPDFFTYDYMFDTAGNSSNLYSIYMYQLSEKGYRTGNSINVEIYTDGTLRAFSISEEYDPEAVDAEYLVSESEALDIAYAAAAERANSDDSSPEIYFDDRESHDIDIYLTYHDDVQKWIIEVSGIETSVDDEMGVKITVTFDANIDANTGEVLYVSDCDLVAVTKAEITLE